MDSCLYTGWVRHARWLPIKHSFTYKVAMACLDLDELDTMKLPSWLFSVNKRRLFSFYRKDYHLPQYTSLKEAILSSAGKKLGRKLGSHHSVKVLTQLGTLGFSFNPVSFYFISEKKGGNCIAVLAEITNTPWSKRYHYVISLDGKEPKWFNKDFHVSPFMPMEQEYLWEFSQPKEELKVDMENRDDHLGRHFKVDLRLSQKNLSTKNLIKLGLAYPWMCLKTLSAIYWNALLLKIKGAPYFAPPLNLKEKYAT